MVTLMSIACGFASIVISVDNALVGAAADYRLAAILLVLAGVFDALDGFVARATNTSSEFGMQLDSIADVMNFGCAPGLNAVFSEHAFAVYPIVTQAVGAQARVAWR